MASLIVAVVIVAIAATTATAAAAASAAVAAVTSKSECSFFHAIEILKICLMDKLCLHNVLGS